MDTLERIKSFHTEQFEDVESSAPVFRGTQIHEGFEFPPDASEDEIFVRLQPSAKAAGYVIIRKGSVKNTRGQVVFKIFRCQHAESYVINKRSRERCLR